MRNTQRHNRSTRALLASGAAVLAFVPLAACGDDDDSASTTTKPTETTEATDKATTTAKGQEGDVITASGPVDLTVGGTATIELEGNVTTGYTWTVSQEPDAAVVKVVSNEYVAPEGGAPGAGGHQKVVLEGVSAGTTTLEMIYAREFEKDQPPAETATFPITVG